MRKTHYALLMAVLSCVTCVGAQAAAPYFGMHIHGADTGTRWPAVGVGSWRLWDASVAWPNLQPERSRWDFVKLDRYVAMAKLTKVEILLPLGLSPAWASARPKESSSYSPGNAAEPRDMEDWRTYVRTVAMRYKGRIRDFEIWNEPNEPGFFSGTPEKLVELTCEAQRVLKSVSPDNRLVSPSMVGEANAPEKLGAFLEKGGKSCVDIVGFHFYVPKGPPEALLPLVERVRAVMKKSGVAQLPLWNTEAGWWIESNPPSSAPDPAWLKRISVEQSGAWVARSLLLGRAAGLERFYWYAWDNKEMGLIDPGDGSYRPGATAFSTVTKWLDGDAVLRCQPEASLWSCRVSRPSVSGATADEELIIWDTGSGAGSMRLPADKAVVSIDYVDGKAASPEMFSALKTLPISGSPLRLVLRKK